MNLTWEEEQYLDEVYGDGYWTQDKEGAIRCLIGRWLSLHSYPEFRNEIRKSVIGQDAVDDVTLAVYFYLQKVAKGDEANTVIMVTAPSGNGKTETYRAIKNVFRRELSYIPCYLYDVSTLTETGFRGSDPSDILKRLETESNGIGIVFCDEIDKKIQPSFDSNSVNVNSKVQQQLLMIFEGNVISIDKKSFINTSNTMFIGMGSFDFVRTERENQENELGFGAVNEESDHFDAITREDIIEAGGSFEFIGRFSQIISFRKLSEKDVRKIIALIRENESEEFGIRCAL